MTEQEEASVSLESRVGKLDITTGLRVDVRFYSAWHFLRANRLFAAFPWECGTLTTHLALLDQMVSGDLSGVTPPLISLPAKLVAFEFHPFDDRLILTSSQDSILRLWRIPLGLSMGSMLSTATHELRGHTRAPDALEFHPSAEGILASGGADKTLRIFDFKAGHESIITVSHPAKIFSLSWNFNGSLLAVTSDDQALSLVDPRVAASTGPAGIAHFVHTSTKPTTVRWFGEWSFGGADRLLTTGFDSEAKREVVLWDVRNLSEPLRVCKLRYSSSTATLLPLVDASSKLVFFAAKGDAVVRVVRALWDQPHLEPIPVRAPPPGRSRMSPQAWSALTLPLFSAALVPRSACDSSIGEISHLLRLSHENTLTRVRYVANVDPRLPAPALVRSRRHGTAASAAFTEDLFADIVGGLPARLSGNEWWKGADAMPTRRPVGAGGRIAAELYPALGSQEFCDVDIVTADGRRLSAHRCMLLGVSPTWNATLDYEVDISTVDRRGEMRLPDAVGAAEAEALLRFCYSDKIRPAPNDPTAERLLAAARACGVVEIIRRLDPDGSAIELGSANAEGAIPVLRTYAERMRYLLNNKRACYDVIFELPATGETGPRLIYAHRVVLAQRAGYFRSMFSSGMAEAKERRVVLREESSGEGITAEAFLALLHYCYLGEVEIAPEALLELFDAAHRYDMEDLRAICEVQLRGFIDLDNCAELLSLALARDSPRLRTACLQCMAAHYAELSEAKVLAGLPEEVVAELKALVPANRWKGI